MSKYNDKELNRLLSDSDELLADLNLYLYETPQEEKARLEKEEALRQAEEAERARQAEEERARQEEEAERARQEEEAERARQAEEAKRARQAEEERARQAEEAERARQAEEAERARQAEEAERARQAEEERARQAEEEAPKQTVADEEEVVATEEKEAATTVEAAEVETEAPIQAEEKQTEEEEISRHINARDSLFGSVLFTMISFMFMETMVHIGTYKSIGTEFIYPLFFSAAFGCMISLLSGFLSVKGNTIVALVLHIFTALYFDLQLVYHATMGSFLRISQLREDMWLLVHSEQMKEAMVATLPWLVLMFLPILLWAIIGRRVLVFGPAHWLTRIVLVIGMVIFAVIGVVLLDVQGYEEYTPYAAFYHYDTEQKAEQAGNQLGMIGLTALEILSLLD